MGCEDVCRDSLWRPDGDFGEMVALEMIFGEYYRQINMRVGVLGDYNEWVSLVM